MSKSLWEIYYSVRDFIKNMKSENLSAYASSTAFFIFVSLVPMLLLICAIIPFTPLTKENLIKILADVVPMRMEGLVENIIENVYVRSTGVLSVAVILAFLTSTTAQFTTIPPSPVISASSMVVLP